MEKMILLSATVVLIQLSDAYLRWLAFSKELSHEKNIKLLKKFVCWSAISFEIYFGVLASNGIGAAEYKAFLMLGWIPYLAIFIHETGGGFLRHIFIFNMSALWSFLQHNWSSFIVISFFLDGRTDAEIILTHAVIYVALFIVMLPIEKYFFTRMLLPQAFFDIRPQSFYIAFLPPVILMAHLIRLADNVLVHSWEERLSRMYLPFVFLFFYKYVLEAARRFYRQRRIEKLERRLGEKLAELKEYHNFMQELQKSVSVMRHDLRHSYRLIYTLLESGDVAKAREYLITQELSLESAVVRPFAESEIVSNALSIYLQRAEDAGIKVFQRIDIPDEFKTDENDFALLLANIFGNAIRDIGRQAEGSRKLSIIIRQEDDVFILEMTAHCDIDIHFDKDGLPQSFDSTSSLGMNSLKNFIKKYNAHVDFSQSDGQLKFSMYWSD